MAAVRRQHPLAAVEVWAQDEHRVGLKPIVRRVWAPKGVRPVVRVRPRYEWVWVYGFVEPATGRTEITTRDLTVGVALHSVEQDRYAARTPTG